MTRPQIMVILADEGIPGNLNTALQRTEAATSFWSLSEALRNLGGLRGDAVVIVVPADTSRVAGALRVLFDRLAEQPRATLVVGASGQPVSHLEHPPVVPVTFAGTLDAHELEVCLATMLGMRESLDSLHRGLLANRRSGESVAKRYARQLRLASQVQREFLPDTLPRLGRVSFNVVFQPVDYVSGDIYDVHRLDEDHVGIALADATGHGIPAALLTVYIKRALRGKEIENGSYRILSPDEVLRRLNEDILEAHLSECQFVAAAYGVLNTRTLELRLARGGLPYPLLRHADGSLDVIGTSGSVVGVLPAAHFEVAHVQLAPGDCLVLYSDGLERIVSPQQTVGAVPSSLQREVERVTGRVEGALQAAREELAQVARDRVGVQEVSSAADAGGGTGVMATSEVVAVAPTPTRTEHGATTSDPDPIEPAAHDEVTGSAWARLLRQQGPAAAMQELEGRQRALRRMGYPLDDLTVLTLHIDD